MAYDINEVNFSCACKLSSFEPVPFAHLTVIIKSWWFKICGLNPLSTSIPKQCIDVVLLASHYNANVSSSLGYFPNTLKKPRVTPWIKRENLDNNNIKNSRPISSFPFVVK